MVTTPPPVSVHPPLHPPGSKILYRISPDECTALDRAYVWASSLFFVGSAFWVPMAYAWAWKKFQSIPKDQRKRRAMYAALLISATALFTFGPHRHPRVGRWLRFREWRLWRSWLRFIAVEVIADQKQTVPIFEAREQSSTDQAILAVVPHGIFPFSLAFTIIGDVADKVFENFRVVIAPATQMLPFVRDVLAWLRPVAASRPEVDRALANGERIAICPGGIAEIFEGYPKKGCDPDFEYSIVQKGIMRMAIKHNVPLFPVYCFGGTKMLRRVPLPQIVETISLALRTSLVLFFGQFGLPVPFRQRLMYVIGNPIYPPPDQSAESMQMDFCNELQRIFERHKESYGWGHKSLVTIKR